jgi:hypothetical protein
MNDDKITQQQQNKTQMSRQRPAANKDDRSVASGVGTSTNSNSLTTSTTMLDQRIANQRKEHGTKEKDRAREDAKTAAMSGVRRQPAVAAKYLTHNNHNKSNESEQPMNLKPSSKSTFFPGLKYPPQTFEKNDPDGDDVRKSTTLKNPSGVPNTTTAQTSLKSTPVNGMSTKAIESRDTTTTKSVGTVKPNMNRINQMEEDAASKARAKGSPTSVVSKRSPTMSVSKQLLRMEAETEAKAKAQEGRVVGYVQPGGTSTIKNNGTSKSSIRLSPSVSSSTKKQLLQQEGKVATYDSSKRTTTNSGAKLTTGKVAIGGSSSSAPSAVRSIMDQKKHEPTISPESLKMDANSSGLASRVCATRVSPSSYRRPGVASMMVTDEHYARKMGLPLDSTELPIGSNHQSGSVTDDKQIDKPSLSKAMQGAPDQSRRLFEGPPHFSCEYEFEDVVKDFDDDDDGDHLAIAMAVAENEDDDEYIPKAVEYDPDAKPPVIKNRRFRLYMAVGCIAMIVIVASTIGVLSLSMSDPSDELPETPPTSAPTCERCGLGIEAALELAVGSDKLYNTSSPYYEAMEWILFEDSRALGPTDTNLLQRYILATFYFDTHQQSEWLSCNRPIEENSEDDTCEHMLLSGITAEGPTEFTKVPSNRWLGAAEECTWAGVSCDEFNQMRHIDLQAYNLQGTFPGVMSLLPYVQSFTFPWNNFEGPLPDDIGSMKHLLNIEFQYNNFSGKFPSAWGRSRNLQLVNVGNNALTGQLPEEIGEMSTLKGLFVMHNELSGPLPESMSNLSLLTFARFQSNMFSGTIPSSFGDMQLVELWLRKNNFDGGIPSELGKLSNSLGDVRLDRTLLDGPIPEEIWNLTNLWRLDLSQTDLTGSISSSIGNLDDLIILNLRDSNFSGPLPSELGQLSDLQELHVHGNMFTGTFPNEVCALRGPEGLNQVYAPTNMECPESCCTHFCQTAEGGGSQCYAASSTGDPDSDSVGDLAGDADEP